MRRWHVVAYDVRDEVRLRRVARLLEGYGERLQLSVFRVHATATELERLRWELTQRTEAEDSVIVVPLCEACARAVRTIRRERVWDPEPERFRIF